MPTMAHFVPRSYLKRFTCDQGFLHVFDRSSRSYRRQRPKEVMKINSYYRQDWVPPGVDPNIAEKILGEWLERDAKDSIDRLIRCPDELTGEETATILIYIESQRIRVPRQFRTAKGLMRATILQLAPCDAADAIRSGKVLLEIKDSARFQYMQILTGKLHPWFARMEFARMEWEVFEAESGAAFVTTDSPVSFYNPRIRPPDEAGLALAGTMVFFPLSSRYILLMRHPEGRIDPLAMLPDPTSKDRPLSIEYGTVWSRDVVDNFNWKMVQLSDQLVVAESKSVLEACVTEV
jgi:hypothetical protein